MVYGRFTTLRVYFPEELPYMIRDSVVGIATRYGLEGPGIESIHSASRFERERLYCGERSLPNQSESSYFFVLVLTVFLIR
jgi:hypothetical protein